MAEDVEVVAENLEVLAQEGDVVLRGEVRADVLGEGRDEGVRLILGEPRLPQPLGGLERVERDHAGIVRARRRRGNGRAGVAARRGA